MLDARHRVISYAGSLLLAMLLATSAFFVGRLLLEWSLNPDFTVFWAAARNPSGAYDDVAVTAAQSFSISPEKGSRPFVYPPTTLLVLAPFGFLSFWAGYWVWIALSSAVFWSAARQITSVRNATLSLLTPHAVLVLILGQTTLVVGAAIIWAVSLLKTKPIVAGLLFGAAAAFKPQSLILAPIALAAGGHWRSLTASVFAGLAAVLLSLPIGPHLWIQWMEDVWAFPALLEFYGSHRMGVTPAMAVHFAPTEVVAGVWVVGVVLGCITVWLAFGRSKDPQLRLLALVGGTILASPYAMRYELAMLAPALVPALLSGQVRGLLIAAPLFAFNAVAAVVALAISCGVAMPLARSKRRLA